MTDRTSRTPLHNAAAGCHPEIVQLLLRLEVPVDPGDRTNRTPLHDAAANGCIEGAAVLIGGGADPGAEDWGGSNTQQFAAARHHEWLSNWLTEAVNAAQGTE